MINFLYIIDAIILSYLFIGFLLWILPFDSGAGYVDVAASDTSFLFIFLWLPAIFSKTINDLL